MFQTNRNQDFNWQTHVDVTTSKAATRLHFLRILKKKSGLNPDHLLHFYSPSYPASVGVLISGLAPQYVQDPVRKSGSYKAMCPSYHLHSYHILLLWATPKFHLSTFAAKMLINYFSGLCLTLLVFSPYCHHPKMALLLPD